MSDDEILIEVAKLDGWRVYPTDNPCRFQKEFPSGFSDLTFDAMCVQCPYLTSRDAIVPVIEKQFSNDTQRSDFICTLGDVCRSENKNWWAWTTLTATPRQLCIALLKATGRLGE